MDTEDRQPVSTRIHEVGKDVVEAAFRVHAELGHGLLASVYETCLTHELRGRGLIVRRKIPVPVVYCEIELPTGLNLDLLVGECVIVQVKVAERMYPVYETELRTFLKLTGYRLGYLVNFGDPVMKNGIRLLSL